MVSSNNLLTNLKTSLFIVLLICAVALTAISQPAYAQINEFKITASDGDAGDEFGFSVSISGDYAVLGGGELTKIIATKGFYLYAITITIY